MPSDADDLCLLLKFDERSTCGTSGKTLEVTIATALWKDEKPHGLGHGDALNHIVVSERIYSDNPEWSAMGELHIDGCYPGTINALEQVLAVAKRIARKLEKLDVEAGRPGSLGASALRFGNAIRAKGMIKRSPQNPNEWHRLGMDMVEHCVNSRIHEFQQKHPAPTRPA